jgi:hypothetical protein
MTDHQLGSGCQTLAVLAHSAPRETVVQTLKSEDVGWVAHYRFLERNLALAQKNGRFAR